MCSETRPLSAITGYVFDGKHIDVCTVVVAGATSPMVDVGQVKLSHRDVFVLLNGVVVTRPDVDHLLFCIAIYTVH